MEYEITKVQKYRTLQSEMIGIQYYNVVYARLYPNKKNKRRFYRVRFIHVFDGEELWGFFNDDTEEPPKESFTEQDIEVCRDELIATTAEGIFYGDDIKEIVENCNDTIERYA